MTQRMSTEHKFDRSYRESKTQRAQADEARWEEELEANPFLALPGSTDASPLVRAAVWFGKGDRTTMLDDFICDNCHIFADASADGLTSDGSGHKIEYANAHNDFLRLFERQVEEFVAEEGFELDAFYNDCKKAIEGVSLTLIENESHRWFVEALLSGLDYNHFHQAMVAANRKANKSRRK